MRFELSNQLLVWLFVGFATLPMCDRFCFGYQESELSSDEKQQVQTAERFFKILEKNPRRGTALEKVYGHHIEFGSLDALLANLTERVKLNPIDDASWMVLGLLESQRGEDSAAIEAFRKAVEFRKNDPLANYYLGQSLQRLGLTRDAVDAFERALKLNPSRADALEMYQQLGRTHQRAQQTEAAVDVWKRLELLFPDDPRVLEQIVACLVEEGAFESALLRYERLASIVKDDYRRVLYSIESASLKIKTNHRDAGIEQLESLLTDINPDSWLFRDIRRRIEDTFLKSSDQDSLVQYYQRWIASHPQDIDAMSRLAKFLSASARTPEAKEWMEKAIALAPTRADLRKAYIVQLVDDQCIPDALAQYQHLAKTAPNNPDFLRDWGKLTLKDKSRGIEARNQEAARIWNQLVELRPSDASNLSQVADLFRLANHNERAIELYQSAISISLNDPQYREYLGEFLHTLRRTEEAMSIWKSIAEGTRRTVDNVVRLAEVYKSFGFIDLAVTEISDACRMDPKDFRLQLRGAEYHQKAGRFDDAIQYVETAQKLAANDDELEMVLKQRIDTLTTSQQLVAEIQRLESVLPKNTSTSASEWHLLARYCETDRQWSAASQAIQSALKLAPASIPILTTASRIAESSSDYGRAADLVRKLLVVDRRSMGEHLMCIAKLEAQLGRTEAAIQAARDLVISAPGNTSNYEFLAQMCFRLRKNEEGLEALRKAVRINPNEPSLIMALGEALASQTRIEEAIEVYWRAFDKSETVDDKTSLMSKLVPLYQGRKQLDLLLDRLKPLRREEEKRREITICIAQVYNLTNDFDSARNELESLLNEETRDTNLLKQLAKTCEDAKDFQAAISYQRQLVALAPGAESEYPLATMLLSQGSQAEAAEILVELTRREEDPSRLLKSIDSLLSRSSTETVIKITEPLLNQQGDNWELLYREAVAWATLNDSEKATQRLESLLSLKIPHETLGVSEEAKFKKSQSKVRSENRKGTNTQPQIRPSPLSYMDQAQRILFETMKAADPRNINATNRQAPQPVWTPQSYGLARMAAYAWLLQFESLGAVPDSSAISSENNAPSALVDRLAEKANNDRATRESQYDYLYALSLRSQGDAIRQVAKRIAKSGDQSERVFFLKTLSSRTAMLSQQSMMQGFTMETSMEPLGKDDLDLMLECVHAIPKERLLGISGPQVNSQQSNLNQQSIQQLAMLQLAMQRLQSPQYTVTSSLGIQGNFITYNGLSGVQLASLSSMAFNTRTLFDAVVSELKLAGRDAQAAELMERIVIDATGTPELSAIMRSLLDAGNFKELRNVYSRWIDLSKKELANPPLSQSNSQSSLVNTSWIANVTQESRLLSNWMGKLGPKGDQVEILSILDPALDLAIDAAKQRRSDPSIRNRKSVPTLAANNPNQPVFQLQFSYGEENFLATVDFPIPNDHLNRNSVQILRQAHEIFQRNGATNNLQLHLRKRLDQAPESNQLYEQLFLASALWWNSEQDEAIALMQKSAESLKDDIYFQLELASILDKCGEYGSALEIVEAVLPNDQNSLQRKEWLALQLAMRLGERERAISAAEQLFGMKWDPQATLDLSARMKSLGLTEMAETLATRIKSVQPARPTITSALARQQRASSQSQSIQSAKNILAQNRSSLTIGSSILTTNAAMVNSSLNPNNLDPYMKQIQSQRSQAIELLKKTGELDRMVAHLEERLLKTPNVPQIVEQLINYYRILDRPSKCSALLEKSIQECPTSVEFKALWANFLIAEGELDSACEQVLEVIRLKPNWFTIEMQDITAAFLNAGRIGDIAESIRSLDVKKIKDPQMAVSFINLLNPTVKAQNGTNLILKKMNSMEEQQSMRLELALELMEKTTSAFPAYRSTLLMSLMRHPQVWSSEIFLRVVESELIPSDSQIASQPWAGITAQNLSGKDGTVTGTYEYLLKYVNALGLQPAAKSIEVKVCNNPNWLGGKALLGIFAIRLGTDDREHATESLTKLFSDDTTIATMPQNAAWLLAQELDGNDKTQELATKLYERAVAQVTFTESFQPANSPVPKLLKLYLKAGRIEDARALLQRIFECNFRSISNASNPNPRSNIVASSLESSLWVADRFFDTGTTIESLQIYRKLLENPHALNPYHPQANVRTINGKSIDYTAQCNSGIERALAALKKSDPKEVLLPFSSPSSNRKPGSPVLDLMSSLPSTIGFSTNARIQSQLLDILSASVATTSRESATNGTPLEFQNGPSRIQILDDHLLGLTKEYPDDLSVWIALAHTRLMNNSSNALDAIERLAAIANASLLESIVEGKRPNLGQRLEAEKSIGLWLVARECLSNATRRGLGSKLGERALEGACRQVGARHAFSILSEWSVRELEQGDIQEAEIQLTRLLKIVTERPKRKPTSDTLKSTANASPPLTLSQFDLAIKISDFANSHNMPKLSRVAVKEAMLGGLPIPDVTSISPTSMRQTGMPPTVLSNTTGMSSVISTDSRATHSILGIVIQWRFEDHPAEEVYAVLKEILFSASRSVPVSMNVYSPKLIPQTIVDWASRAKKLDDLKEEIDRRVTTPAFKDFVAQLKAMIEKARQPQSDTTDPLPTTLDDPR